MCFPSDLFLSTCVNIADFHNLNQTIRRGGGYSPLIWTIWIGAAQQGKFLCFSDSTPYLGESKTVLDCGFHAVDSGFQVLYSSSFLVELGFRIPWAVFWIPTPTIPDSLTSGEQQVSPIVEAPFRIKFHKRHGLETATFDRWNGDKRHENRSKLRQRQRQTQKTIVK